MNYGSGIYTKANRKQTQEVKMEMEHLGDQKHLTKLIYKLKIVLLLLLFENATSDNFL